MRYTVVAGLLASVATYSIAAAEEPPPDRVFVLHSRASGHCPALNWNIGVDDQSHALSGIIAWGDKMQSVARASGKFEMADRSFTMKAKEVGGRGRTADITGQVRNDGWLVANITGPGIKCNSVTIPWYRPGGPGPG